ncbi:hypothetical protein ACGF12_23720 [Kitasatospora sp. NPDC048296]|jgi:hypothetical protein|uniref:hypothetical protein n=1 Tax=unclassified Kitasatospora TaxID=2633591 RepID=UPI0036DAD5D6
MARRGGELEAFIAFLGGLLAAGLTALAMAGVGLAVRPTPALKAAAMVTLGAVWLTVTTTVYLRLKPRNG